MALDWSNERYVRLYARLTPDQAAWCWEAKAIWPWVLVAADGAGLLLTAKAARGVAAVLAGGGFPLQVVEAGLTELVTDGCLVRSPGGYVVRNYCEAQTATSSGTRRQAAYRDRERAKRALEASLGDASVTPGDASVTPGDDALREVTRGDAGVTPIRSDPIRDLSLGIAREAEAPPAPPARPALHELVDYAIDRLNAARREVDPDAPPIPVIADQPCRDLLDHLRPVPEADRRPTLDRAIDVMLATLAEERRPVGEYRMAMLSGPRSWARWRDGSVASARGRDGPAGRRAPPPRSRPLTGLAASLADDEDP